MKKILLLLFFLIIVSGCVQINEDDATPTIEQNDKTYSFNEVTDFEINLSHSVIVSMNNINYTVYNQVKLANLISFTSFKVDYDELKYDYKVTFKEGTKDFEVFVIGKYDAAVIKLYGDDGTLYSSVKDVDEITLMMSDGIGAENNVFETYEKISDLEGYTLYKLRGDAYNDFLIEDFNSRLYVPAVVQPAVINEVNIDGELIIEILSEEYTEHMTTKLEYPFAVYYVKFEDNRYSIDDSLIPKRVLEHFIAEDDDLFLFAIIFE